MMSTAAVNSHDRILLKALALFSEKGYDATSVREICEAAGITKPTLYHFYGSKEGVYRALVEGALARFGADMSRALAGDGTIREQLARMARAYIDAALREPQLSRFLMALIHSSKHSAPATDFVGFYQGVVAGVGRAIDAAVARGELAPGPTQIRLLVLMGALAEAMIGYLLCGQPQLSHELADGLVDVVLRGWQAPLGPGRSA
jgi:TetR/AcrR family transcriptional regulator